MKNVNVDWSVLNHLVFIKYIWYTTHTHTLKCNARKRISIIFSIFNDNNCMQPYNNSDRLFSNHLLFYHFKQIVLCFIQNKWTSTKANRKKEEKKNANEHSLKWIGLYFAFKTYFWTFWNFIVLCRNFRLKSKTNTI